MAGAWLLIVVSVLVLASYLLMEYWERKRDEREWQKYEEWCKRNRDRDA